MFFKGNKKGKMMSESLFLNLFVCLFVFFAVAWTMKNDCFRVCLIFHFINRLFAHSSQTINVD